MGIIYRITNNAPESSHFGQMYVGQAASLKNYRSRLSSHKSKSSNEVLQCDINKYGVERFIFEYEEFDVDHETLNDLEIAAISKYDCLYPGGYNLTIGGAPGSEKTRKKSSDANLGNKNRLVNKHRRSWGSSPRSR